jgi:hypothetical protein
MFGDSLAMAESGGRGLQGATRPPSRRSPIGSAASWVVRGRAAPRRVFSALSHGGWPDVPAPLNLTSRWTNAVY